jgi:hypothetical protein
MALISRCWAVCFQPSQGKPVAESRLHPPLSLIMTTWRDELPVGRSAFGHLIQNSECTYPTVSTAEPQNLAGRKLSTGAGYSCWVGEEEERPRR